MTYPVGSRASEPKVISANDSVIQRSEPRRNFGRSEKKVIAAMLDNQGWSFLIDANALGEQLPNSPNLFSLACYFANTLNTEVIR